MRHRLWHADSVRRDERGTVTLIAAVMLAVLMLSGAFAVDLGLQRVARADMQALADLVALDLARELDGRTVSELEPVLPDAVAASLARNADVVGQETPDLEYQLGVMGGTGFQPITSGVPTAVSVEAHTEVAFAFAGVTGKNEGEAARTAQAESTSTACFKLGSFVAAIRSGNSAVLGPLNDLLGANLDLASYKALAAADVRLAQLVAVSSMGTPEYLLQGRIQYRALLTAMVEALSREAGESNAAAITALERIISSTVTSTVGTITLGDVLNISPTDGAALQVELNALDIVGAARLSNGRHFLEVPNIQAGVAGLGNQFSGQIYVISAANMACGVPNDPRANAKNAQLGGALGLDFFNLPSINVPKVGTLQTAKGTGRLSVEVGSGEGQLVAPPPVYCGENTPDDPSTMSVDVDTDLATYRLDTNLTVTGEVKASVLEELGLAGVVDGLLGGLLGGNRKLSLEVDLTLSVGTSEQPSAATAHLSLPPNDVTPVQIGDSATLNADEILPTINAVKIDGRTIPLHPALAGLTDAILGEVAAQRSHFVAMTLRPLVDNINQTFIGPVAQMIGLRLGGADVFAVAAACGVPRLVG